MFKAGVAIRDITPMGRTKTGGYPNPTDRSALIAHDPLYTSAFYFENETEKTVFITADLISLSCDRANEVRMLVEKHTGIPRKNVSISCTHTHSGPITGGQEWERYEELNELNPDNTDRIRNLMLEAVKEAVSTAFYAKIGWGTGLCGKEKGIGGNRHDPEHGPCDPRVSVLAIQDTENTLRGCLVNYALHPTVLHADNFCYTADYPGYIRQTVNARYPFAIFGFQMGSAGDQSSRFFRNSQSFSEAKRIGTAIGETALETMDKMPFSEDIVLKCASVKAVPPIKHFPSHKEALKILQGSKEKYEHLLEIDAPYSEIRAAQSIMEGSIFMEGFTRSLKGTSAEEFFGGAVVIECHAMRIGDCCMVGIGCEHFVAIGNAVKDASPFEVTMVSGVTNGNTLGYICTDEAYERFCYEAQCSIFAKGAQKELTTAALEAMRLVE